MNICISSVGEEIRPILYGIRKISGIDKLFLLCSNQTETYAKKLMKYTNKIYNVKIIKTDPTNILDPIEKILFEINKEKEIEKIFINITGGTKIMSVSLFILSTIVKSDAFYIFKDSDNKMNYIKLPNIQLKLVKLTPRQYEILGEINKNEMNLTDLSKSMNVTKPTIFSFLNRFKKENLIRIDSNKHIYLTEYGKLILMINKVNVYE